MSARTTNVLAASASSQTRYDHMRIQDGSATPLPNARYAPHDIDQVFMAIQPPSRPAPSLSPPDAATATARTMTITSRKRKPAKATVAKEATGDVGSSIRQLGAAKSVQYKEWTEHCAAVEKVMDEAGEEEVLAWAKKTYCQTTAVWWFLQQLNRSLGGSQETLNTLILQFTSGQAELVELVKELKDSKGRKIIVSEEASGDESPS